MDSMSGLQNYPVPQAALKGVSSFLRSGQTLECLLCGVQVLGYGALERILRQLGMGQAQGASGALSQQAVKCRDARQGRCAEYGAGALLAGVTLFSPSPFQG